MLDRHSDHLGGSVFCLRAPPLLRKTHLMHWLVLEPRSAAWEADTTPQIQALLCFWCPKNNLKMNFLININYSEWTISCICLMMQKLCQFAFSQYVKSVWIGECHISLHDKLFHENNNVNNKWCWDKRFRCVQPACNLYVKWYLCNLRHFSWLKSMIVWMRVDDCMPPDQYPPPTPHTHTHNSTFSESQTSASVNTHVRSAQQQRYTLDPQWNMCILHTWSFQTDGK